MKSKTEKCVKNAARALKRMMNLCERVSRSGKEVRRLEAYRQAERARSELLSILLSEKVAEIAGDRNAMRKADQISESVAVIVIVHGCNAEK